MPAPIDETRILDAALAVWREEGFRDATTRKVAAHAGIGEVTLFRRFGDKAALFRAALAREAELFAADRIAYSGELLTDLVAVVEAYRAMLARNGEIVLDFLVNAPRDEALRSLAPVPLGAMLRVADILMRYQAEGVLRPAPPSSLVLALLSPILMSHALSRSQPALASNLEASGVVEKFLTGWTLEAAREAGE
jgi:AcrR family transcriptional regulator